MLIAISVVVDPGGLLGKQFPQTSKQFSDIFLRNIVILRTAIIVWTQSSPIAFDSDQMTVVLAVQSSP